MKRADPTCALVVVVAAVIACGPPQIVARDHETLAKICALGTGLGAGTRDSTEEARAMKALDDAYCHDRLLGGKACPNWRENIVGVCVKTANSDPTHREYKFATVTSRTLTKRREEICDALRKTVSATDGITVYCRDHLQCSTKCGKPR